MICEKCGNVYRDFTSVLGTCKDCREKSIINAHKYSLKDSIEHSMTITNTNNTGRNITSNVAKHMNICDELNKLYEKKNNDYGDSFSSTFKEFGLIMSAIRLQDKLERFKRLSKGNESNVKDESIRDTLVDLANYAIMTIMELEKSDEKTKSN